MVKVANFRCLPFKQQTGHHVKMAKGSEQRNWADKDYFGIEGRWLRCWEVTVCHFNILEVYFEKDSANNKNDRK